MNNSPITLDVISDVVCPWCYLGKRRLARAIDLIPEVDLVVRWRPFRLDPTIPPEGIERSEYLIAKFGSVEAVDDGHRHLEERGREEGINYNFERITRSPNTVDAHRLIHWSAAEGIQNDMVERLFAAYFSEGLDIGDQAVLASLAAEVGFDLDTVADRLASDEDRDMIVGEIENAYRIGVTGVPCFIVDRRLAVTGAHPSEILVQAIQQVAAERETPKAATN